MSLITDKLVDFTQVHKDCIQCYKAQLAGLKVKKNQAVLSKEELNAMWLDELKEKKKEVGNLKNPNKEEYKMCEVLHQKLDMLYNELEELKVGDKIGSKKNKTRNKREIKLAKLKLKQVSWANDNDKYLRSQEELPHILCLGIYEDNNDEEQDSISIITDPISMKNTRNCDELPESSH